MKADGLVTNGSSLPYNPKLTERAKEMRKNMTPAEKKMWHTILANKKYKNLRWLRQKPINHFIVDFYCAKLKLVIEIDGDSHAAQEGYDAERTNVLESYGLKVIRFSNAEIMQNVTGVFEKLNNVYPSE